MSARHHPRPGTEAENLRRRLSLLMFLQYAAPGALLPLFSLRLHELHFTPVEIGWACATQALAGLVGPLLAGQVADRWVAAERCLAVCAVVAGGLLWLLSELTSPLAVFCTSLAIWLALAPALTLGTSICFAHLRRPERHFGRVRLWGTVGWVAASWALGCWFHDPEWGCRCLTLLRPHWPRSEPADAFRLAGVLAFAFAAYALTLPHTPPQHRPNSSPLAPLAALRLLRQRNFALCCLVCLGCAATVALTSQLTPLLLVTYGIPRSWLALLLTIAQGSEVACLALLPTLLARCWMRDTVLIGLAVWTAALVILTAGRPLWLVVGSLLCNGFCVAFCLVASQVFINSRARGDIRASAQALLTLINSLGMLAGNVLVGWFRHAVGGAFPPTYAAGVAVTLTVFFVFFFGFRAERSGAAAVRRTERPREPAVAPAAE
jgi:predicted MFS family arabinose efflux permease